MLFHHGWALHLPVAVPGGSVASHAAPDALLQMLQAGNALHRRGTSHLTQTSTTLLVILVC